MANIVLGGGIGGLSTAYYLSKQSSKGVRLVEACERLGGWIRTSKSEEGTIFEHGPRTIRPRGVAGNNTLQLIEELGLVPSVMSVTSSHSAARNRMIYVDKQLHLLPNSIMSLLKTTPPFTQPLLFCLVKDLFAPKKKVPDESIYDFVERRLGRELADFAISPMICGVFAGDAKEISVKALLNQVFEIEQKYGGIALGVFQNLMSRKKKDIENVEKSDLYARAVKEKWSVWSLHEGLETLPQHLDQCLKKNQDVRLSVSTKCTKLSLSKGKVVATLGKEQVTGEHVYCSLPSYELAKLLGHQHPYLHDQLKAIPYVTVAVVNLAYEGQVLEKNGFGFLVPPNQNIPILGVIFDSCCFPQEGKTVLTVMMGGRWFEQQFGSNPTHSLLLDNALKHIRLTLNIQQQPLSSSVSVLNNCIPQYVIGHAGRVEAVRRYITDQQLPLSLVGAAYDGVGVNDVILSARTAVEAQRTSTT